MADRKRLPKIPRLAIEKITDPNFNKHLPPLEWKNVSLPRSEKYFMPERCVVCTAPSGEETIRTTHQQVSGRIRASLSLDFPLCDECKAVDDTIRKNSMLASLVAFGVAVLGFVSFMMVMYFTRSQPGIMICPGLIGAAVLFALLLALLNWLFGKRYPKPIHERQKRIDTAVRITSFASANIFFQFSNVEFARLFKQVNQPGKVRMEKQTTKKIHSNNK